MIKCLLTSFARSVQECIRLKLSYKGRRSEVCARKPMANTFLYRPSETRLIRYLLYGFWFIFFSVFALCSSSDVDVYLTSELDGFASCLHLLCSHLSQPFCILENGMVGLLSFWGTS